MQDTILQLVLHAGLLVKVVLLILILFSVICWGIILYKHYALGAAGKESDRFVASFENTRDLKAVLEAAKKMRWSPLANVFKNVFATAQRRTHREEIRRSLRRYEALESERLHSYLTFLATTGTTAPFIGLFGTVWGIMNAFRGIGAAGSASLAVVAPGIAEALITTAAGLAAAIPAVMAYNYYLSRARRMTVEMEDFSEELLEIFSGTSG